MQVRALGSSLLTLAPSLGGMVCLTLALKWVNLHPLGMGIYDNQEHLATFALLDKCHN